MKVHGPSKPNQVSVREVASAARPQAKTRNKPAGERVEVSPRAQALSAVRDPEVPDAGRIERLKAAIAEGTFRIDPDRIAEAMLHEEI